MGLQWWTMVNFSLVTMKSHLVGGLNPSENYEFVSWDDDIPNIWKVIKIPWFHTTNQKKCYLRFTKVWDATVGK